jgi:diamine N-acetyltransferase
MGMITIRRANNADAELIADMSRQTFYDTFAESNTPENMDKFMDGPFAREKLIAELSDPESIFLLAYHESTPVGYARIREGERFPQFNGRPSIEVGRIYATRDSIGKGVGKELMTECIRIARELNREIIWLGVWEKNHRAIDFYTKWGFVKFSDHPFVLGDDIQTDWLMKKEL